MSENGSMDSATQEAVDRLLEVRAGLVDRMEEYEQAVESLDDTINLLDGGRTNQGGLTTNLAEAPPLGEQILATYAGQKIQTGTAASDLGQPSNTVYETLKILAADGAIKQKMAWWDIPVRG